MPPVEWQVSDRPVAYETALAVMTARAEAISRGDAPELVWLLEHPALYTAGTSARPGELIEARFPVHSTGRGGQFTYHGPGQRVGYVMLDLKRRAPDVRRFVATIEEWIIRTLAAFNVRGERREDRIGVWVSRPDKGEANEDKIAAIGIRVRHWVTLHGFALNIEPDLSHFSGIVPCGVTDSALRRHLARRSRPHRVDAGGGHGAARGLRAAVRRRHRRSNGTEHREQFVAAAQRDLVGRGLALIDEVDARCRRSGAAGLDHRQHRRFQPAEQRFDRAVAAIAHPALQAALKRRHLGPGAIADALDATADQHVTMHGQANSPSLR